MNFFQLLRWELVILISLFLSSINGILYPPIRIFLACEAVSAAFAKGCTAHPNVLVFVEPATKLLHEQELGCPDASRNPDDVDQDQEDAKSELVEFPSHVVNAVSDLWRTVCLLAARLGAVHSSFETELNWEEESALVDPILLALLDCVLCERLVTPVPIVSHIGHVVEDYVFFNLASVRYYHIDNLPIKVNQNWQPDARGIVTHGFLIITY